MMVRSAIVTTALAAVLGGAGLGCGQDEGPAERAGRALDETAQEIESEMDELADEYDGEFADEFDPDPLKAAEQIEREIEEFERRQRAQQGSR